MGLLSSAMAGCSSDVTRFGSLFEAPDNRQQTMAQVPVPAGDVTGSVQPTMVSTGTGYGTPAVTSNTLPPAPGAVVSNAPYVRPAVGGQPGFQQPTSLATLPPSPAQVQPMAQTAARAAGWSAEGGTPVVIRPGETVQTVARRFGVPETAILQANGLTANAAVQPGQQLIIPSYSYGGSSQAVAAKPAAQAPAQTAMAAGPGGVYVVKPGDSLGKIANAHGMRSRELAAANGIDPNAPIKIGQKLSIPGAGAGNTRVASLQTGTMTDANPAAPVAKPQMTLPAQAAQPLAQPTTQPVAQAPVQQPVAQQTQVASLEPTPPAAAQPQVNKPVGTQVAAAATGTFRWPVRGRVISGFGTKANGERNDGLNIEVPEGTPIKAAEGGTVIYAGNELKGYGNLVLVKHPNGFVSAYAHASEILVKRGDAVMRGQTLGKVGATGNVTRPQLHFEIRNGNRPVDPIPHLQG
ncbi:peptidoglycan DD-metalloendopeptidase family protein [Chthonobacter albigriseus]|uniref:peptidoglycan DD-metalloendopeptidase family protein n=1 Tax=Chthonobacter albigriseus TaxID=1683161 RepID=UPI0031406970